MTIPTTAQRLIDFRRELAASPGFDADLLNDILRDAARATIESNGLMTHPDLAYSETVNPFPRASQGVGESKSPA